MTKNAEKRKRGPYDQRVIRDRQLLFARKYVELKFQAGKAALAAGFSEKNAADTATRLLRTDVVQREIARLVQKGARKATMTAETIIHEYEAIASADITDVVKWVNEARVSDDGKTVELKGVIFAKPSDRLPPNIRRAIKEVRQTREGITVVMHDKNAALGKLEAILQMPSATQRHVHTGEGGGPIQHEVTKITRRIVDPAEAAGDG